MMLMYIMSHAPCRFSIASVPAIHSCALDLKSTISSPRISILNPQLTTLRHILRKKARPLMHELFLTAAVVDDDCQLALQILQGYCAMPPTPLLRRRLYWNGPLVNNRGLDVASLMPQGPRARFWVGLHEQLVRQAYTVLLLYDVKREEFPKADTPADEKV